VTPLRENPKNQAPNSKQDRGKALGLRLGFAFWDLGFILLTLIA
jgi:hypothetical protein